MKLLDIEDPVDAFGAFAPKISNDVVVTNYVELVVGTIARVAGDIKLSLAVEIVIPSATVEDIVSISTVKIIVAVAAD